MAIITISRQVAARGDEVATILAQKIGYEFITRKKIGAKILELGFPGEKMKKYDEIKPGFFASLTKDRDEYLDYLQTAILEFAVKGNCIFIG
ncbi:MAG: cytidylate kinase family protein, partial [Spirochaetaceae bacterium]|nr:cytidylate kinase family protein [Spirochaetaceae bacterium]